MYLFIYFICIAQTYLNVISVSDGYRMDENFNWVEPTQIYFSNRYTLKSYLISGYADKYLKLAAGNVFVVITFI